LKPKKIKIEEEQMQYVVYLYSGTVALHKDATES